LRLLLDTHVAIWVLVSPKLLSDRVRELIAAAEDGVHVSAVSVWEIAIKHALGKADAPPFSGTEAVGYFREGGFVLLDITSEHAAAVETLPPLHGDPFDRLLVAQALAEPLRLVTHDPRVAAYSDAIIHF
jgi:PIN domain nuclease of toxin-antitoxin system